MFRHEHRHEHRHLLHRSDRCCRSDGLPRYKHLQTNQSSIQRFGSVRFESIPVKHMLSHRWLVVAPALGPPQPRGNRNRIGPTNTPRWQLLHAFWDNPNAIGGNTGSDRSRNSNNGNSIGSGASSDSDDNTNSNNGQSKQGFPSKGPIPPATSPGTSTAGPFRRQTPASRRCSTPGWHGTARHPRPTGVCRAVPTIAGGSGRRGRTRNEVGGERSVPSLPGYQRVARARGHRNGTEPPPDGRDPLYSTPLLRYDSSSCYNARNQPNPTQPKPNHSIPLVRIGCWVCHATDGTARHRWPAETAFVAGRIVSFRFHSMRRRIVVVAIVVSFRAVEQGWIVGNTTIARGTPTNGQTGWQLRCAR